jgi:prepilin-type N-terminal cleavage/methylation domain-containing protein
MGRRTQPGAGRPTVPHITQQAGFTLVELIVLVAVLGVLAATALPRYADLRAEAHNSAVAATAAGFRSAIFLANAACIARGHAGGDNLPSFGAGNVDFNANCFPSSTNGNNSLNVNAARCLQIWNGVLAAAPRISTPANDPAADYRAQGGGTVCTYTYRRDTAVVRRFTYNAATGAVLVTNP